MSSTLDNSYVPIDVSGLGQQKVQISKRYNYLFIALQSRIYVYVPSFPSQNCPTAPAYILRSDPVVPVTGFIDPGQPHAINSLTVGDLGFEEVVVSAHDDGDVCVWYTRDLSRIAMRLSAEKSAWGVALHKERRLLAVSANSHIIKIFQLGIRQEDQQTKAAGSGDGEDKVGGWGQYEKRPKQDTNEVPTSTARPRTYASVAATGLGDNPHYSLPGLTPEDPYPYRRMVKTLKGHENNIPSISFLDEPTGRWLVGTDINGVVIIWDIMAEKIVQKTKLGLYNRALRGPGSLRGWSVTFLKPECFKPVGSIYEALGYPTPPDKSKAPSGSEAEKQQNRNDAYNISPMFLTQHIPSASFPTQQDLVDGHQPYEDLEQGDGLFGDEESEGLESASDLSDYQLLQTLANEDINDFSENGSLDLSVDLSVEGDDEDATMAGLGDIASRSSELESVSVPSVEQDMADANSGSLNIDDAEASVTAHQLNEVWGQLVLHQIDLLRRRTVALNQTSNTQSYRRVSSTPKPRAPSVPRESEMEAQRPPFSFIFSTTEHDCQLLDTNKLAHLVHCRHVLHPHPSTPLHLPHYGGFDRLNMVCIIPELSTVVAASQIGQVAIFRLTRYGNEFLMRLDYILPRERGGPQCPDDQLYRPAAALLGIATGPIQGREVGFGSSRGSDEDFFQCSETSGYYYRSGRKRSGWRGVEKQRRYRLMMVYTDGTVLSYELGREPQGGSILADGFLIV